MNINLEDGVYVVAVSGGVDSMVLLDLLIQKSRNKKDAQLHLIVAHFNHGIRPDSSEDESLVAEVAKRLSLPFEVGYGDFKTHASEEKAREQRYKFLEEVKTKHKAKGIITAHHEDDLIETAFINILRGTGPQGLSAMQNNLNIKRPLLGWSKKEVLSYAKENAIKWREDSTNQDPAYLRNYIRLNIMPGLKPEKRLNLIKQIEKIVDNSAEKQQIIATISHKLMQKNNVLRSQYISLPPQIRNELIMYWLRQNGLTDYDRRLISRLDIVIKTSAANTKHIIKNNLWLEVEKQSVRFNAHT
jgi:tRNA(Ile)-lysidine synthetase-like protein